MAMKALHGAFNTVSFKVLGMPRTVEQFIKKAGLKEGDEVNITTYKLTPLASYELKLETLEGDKKMRLAYFCDKRDSLQGVLIDKRKFDVYQETLQRAIGPAEELEKNKIKVNIFSNTDFNMNLERAKEKIDPNYILLKYR